MVDESTKIYYENKRAKQPRHRLKTSKIKYKNDKVRDDKKLVNMDNKYRKIKWN